LHPGYSRSNPVRISLQTAPLSIVLVLGYIVRNLTAANVIMNSLSRWLISFLLISAFLSNALPCGPGYVTPLFDTTSAPESPYADFAAGRLGIIKPSYHRSVLFAAYRYIAGSGLNASEQQAIVDVWRAELDNKDFADNTIDEVVKAWVAKRTDVVGKEEKMPEIYAERAYGGYDFFPNCTKNAFETAIETLSDRVTANGPSDPGVLNWVHAQDEVFQNCSSGKQPPDDVSPGSPDWLQKDRAYQKAAAEFYSLDYDAAKRDFGEIAQDAESPWQETADYLVARTLIRQASLTKSAEKAAAFYDEAEIHLQRFTSRSGKFTSSADGLMGLIKYRRHPQERVHELAGILASYSGNDRFRQDMIDYNWLLDKFESQVLAAEEKRKAEEAARHAEKIDAPDEGNTSVIPNPDNSQGNSNTRTEGVKKNDDDLTIYLSSDDYQQNWTVYVRRDATDDEAIAEAEKVVGHALTVEMKNRVREARRSAYAGQFKEAQQPAYEGGYYGEEKMTPSLMPAFLKQDDLTDWLYTFQMKGAEPYLYSLSRFKAGGSELWLMTALSQADKNSTGLPQLLQAANNTSRSAAAFQTIAYHTARILLEQGRSADARKLIDEMLDQGDQLPISARNSFLGLRLRLAETLEDFLKFSLRRPYAFDFDGDVGSVDEIIAEQKKWYDPEYNKDGRDAYDREVEDRYKEERQWQERTMFDSDTVEVFNHHFPTTMLLEVERSPALPDYLRERFINAIWTRSFLVDDFATLRQVTPELARYRPEFAEQLETVTTARTQAALDRAVLYFVLKNSILSPFIEDGTGKSDNEQGQFDSNDWWCAPYDTEYDDTTSAEVPKKLPPRPAFLTGAQSQAAQTERKKLAEIGDAPKFLAEKVLEWAKQAPADRRVPEALYIAIQANGWTKYGCGNNEELRDQMTKYLKARYPNSEWTAKLIADENTGN
jgi:hypothetical protein